MTDARKPTRDEMTPAPNSDSLLAVDDLRTSFFTEAGEAKAVDGVSFSIAPGSTLGLVGESGCGKSVTALSILRLVADPGRIVAGEIRYQGENLLLRTKRGMRSIRGSEISMIFQEPMTSLNPVFTIGAQIIEAVRLHQAVTLREAWQQSVDMLDRVGIADPEQRMRDYPHQMSGGMKQRAMIAMALVCRPSLLIADEPTTALDVTIQAQILDLLRALQRDLGMAILLITHDLGIVAEMADHVAVMYAGRIVEYAGVGDLFRKPRNPYTQGLFASLPSIGEAQERLEAIPGNVPDATRFPRGCRFHPRCKHGIDRCATEAPPLEKKTGEHSNACWVLK